VLRSLAPKHELSDRAHELSPSLDHSERELAIHQVLFGLMLAPGTQHPLLHFVRHGPPAGWLQRAAADGFSPSLGLLGR